MEMKEKVWKVDVDIIFSDIDREVEKLIENLNAFLSVWR